MAEKKVIGIKVGAEDYRRLEIIADRENMSISAILKLCVNAIINNEIELEKGELKLGVNYVCEDLDTPFGEKVERKLNKLREREYPEWYIEALKEQETEWEHLWDAPDGTFKGRCKKCGFVHLFVEF